MSTAPIVDAGVGRPVPVTRRRALGRLFGIGAGAAAAVALPAPVQAAPVEIVKTVTVETLPDWLGADPEMGAIFERIARALPLIEDARSVGIHRSLLDSHAAVLEVKAGLREPILPPERAPEPTRARLVDDDRVAVIRFGSLDKNARRRAQRWIAQQPIGDEHPLIRLRLGRRFIGAGEAGYDFLDVARPKDYPWRESPNACALRVFEDFKAAVGRTRGAAFPSVGAYSLLCSHYGHDAPGARTTMAAFPDGRLATHVYELM